MKNTEVQYCIERNSKYLFLDWDDVFWDKTPFHSSCLFEYKDAFKLAKEYNGKVKKVIINKVVVE